MSQVVVLGGGPAGLYAALLLARRDIPVTVLEREGAPGGLTAGTEVAGIPVDFGSHRLHPSIDDGILEDLEAVLGGNLEVRRRNGRIRIDGTWISFPLSIGEMVARLRLSTIARLGLGAVVSIVTPSRSDSFADVVSTGLGKPMGEIFYFPYAQKVWGLSPDDLSGEQARRRIAADSPWKLIRKAVSRDGPGNVFHYPRQGFGRIASGLASAAADAGADVRLGEPVEKISGLSPVLEVTTPLTTHEARLVLSTIPVTALASFMDVPAQVDTAVHELSYRAMVLVYLVVPRSQWTVYDAHYFPEGNVPFTRISEPKNYRNGDDDGDLTVLCVEIPCEPEDGVWSGDDARLKSMVRESIVTMGLPDPGKRGEVHRIRTAYPVYRVGSEAAFDQVSRWLDTQSGVVTFGRQGLFAHDNTHHTLVMARDAVACISEDLDFDAAAWTRARERFARHVVED